jgi:hypothetical protein
MELHLKIIGLLLMSLAFVHVIFPRYFKWKEELKSLSLINREMTYVHTFFIALIVLMFGVLSFFYSFELVHTPFGKVISLGMGIFWFFRLLAQFFGYSSENWRGKRFETIVHVVFTLLWVYMTSVYCLIYLILS